MYKLVSFVARFNLEMLSNKLKSLKIRFLLSVYNRNFKAVLICSAGIIDILNGPDSYCHGYMMHMSKHRPHPCM